MVDFDHIFQNSCLVHRQACDCLSAREITLKKINQNPLRPDCISSTKQSTMIYRVYYMEYITIDRLSQKTHVLTKGMSCEIIR